MWDPSRITPEQVDAYLIKSVELFRCGIQRYGKDEIQLKKHNLGLSEDVALKYLMMKDYNVIEALYSIQQNPNEIKQEVMSRMNRLEERIECIAY
jgi:hypothetical protein